MNPDTEWWPFEDDATQDDPLTGLRIAVTSSHPRWAYLVAFDRQSEERPTDAEAAQLRSYLDEYLGRFYMASYRAKMALRALDVDGGANGVIFHKWSAGDWGYRRRTYDLGFPFSVVPPGVRHRYPNEVADAPYTLAALMDRIHQGGGREPCLRWEEWKAAHPDVFEVTRGGTR